MNRAVRARPLTLLGVLSALWLLAAGAAHATPPGFNGRIAYSTGEGIVSVAADGVGWNELSDGADIEAAWSPGGAMLAFARMDEGGGAEIWRMNADGSGKTKLASVGWSPAWSPDGSKLAYADGPWWTGGSAIHVMNADGSGDVEIGEGTWPDWSPTGDRIAFTTPGGDIALMDPDGGNVTILTPGAQPDWSPDGTRIAFTRWVDGSGQVAVMTSSGANIEILTNTPSHSENPSWSPDGTKIVFQTHLGSLRWSVFSMNADGSGVKNLTPWNGESRFPAWQPSSVRLLASGLAPPPDPRWSGAIVYGRKTTLSARLFWHGATSNTSVSFFAQPRGGVKRLIGARTAGADGVARLTVSPRKHTTYSVAWGGDEQHPAGAEALAIAVRAATRTTLSGFYARAGAYRLYRLGRPVVQKGTVAPNHAGNRLVFVAERLRRGRWTSFARGSFRLGKRSSAVASIAPPPGTYRVRNEFLGDADHSSGWSAWTLLRVRP